MLLPQTEDQSIHHKIRQDEALCLKAVDVICQRHGLTSQDRIPFKDGTTIVYGVGQHHVIKLFSPCYLLDRNREAKALSRLFGRLNFPTPQLVASGELDGWPYVVMTRIHGHLLSQVWNDVPHGDKRRLCRELGSGLARLHQIPLDDMAEFGLDWPQFITQQYDGCFERQKSTGLEASWLDQLPAYLKGIDLEPLKNPSRLAFLHTEIMRQHLFVEQGPQGWRFSGLFDFEPAMIGDPAYEFSSVALFVTGGAQDLLQEVLTGYGEHLSFNPAKTFMQYTLLHRYSNFKWYLEVTPLPPGCRRFQDLEQAWFSV